MLKHPARNYIHYLLSRRIYDVQQVMDRLPAIGIALPPEDGEALEALTASVVRVRKEMRFPFGFNPHSRTPTPQTLAFLRRWQITDVWQNPRFILAATDILSHSPVRRMLELLLMSPMSPQSIAKRIAIRHNMPLHAMNVGVVLAYRNYFWDTTSLSLTDWRNFIQTHYEDSDFAEEMSAALQTPRSATGIAYILSIVDKDPRLVQIADRYRMTSAMGFKLFMNHALGKSVKDTYAAFAALNVMRTSDLELEKHQGGDSELLAEMRRFEAVHDDTKPLSLNDLGFLRPALPMTAEGEETHD